MAWREGVVDGFPPKVDPGTPHPVRKPLPSHPDGIVVFIFTEDVRDTMLQPIFREVVFQRAILCFSSSEKACKAVAELAGSVVCVVSERKNSVAVSKFLRIDCRLATPLIVLAKDDSIKDKAALFGTTVITDANLLIARILACPTLRTIQSEASAGLLQGLLVNIEIGTEATKGTDWVFSDNRQWLLQGMHSSRMTWYPRVLGYDDHVSKVAAYMQGLQPVHRCSPGTFLAILREGGLLSRTELEKLFGSGDEKSRRKVAITRVARHVRLLEIARDQRFAHVSRWVFKYAEAKAQIELAEDDDEKEKAEKYKDKSKPMGLSDEDMADLQKVVDEVVQDVINSAAGSVTGIGYHKDAKLGTAHHVFATIGPNRGFLYGSVVIFLNRGLMYHPDTWISPLAGTGYMGPHFWVFRHRPWSCAALTKIAKQEDEEAYSGLDELPASEEKGVEACLKSCLNMAAVEGWSNIMAREVDAMCHHLSFDHRTAYAFDDGTRSAAGHGLDWQDEEVRKKSASNLLDEQKTRILPEAWKQVIEYYETKDSHTLYEAHLPAFVPLGAIEKVIISKGLFENHTDIKEKVDSFVLPDERRLKDLIVITETGEECMEWQQKWFEDKRKRNSDWHQDWLDARQERSHWEARATRASIAAECERCLREPISVRIAGRQGRPFFLPPDVCYWGRRFKEHEYEWWKAQRSREMRVSFATRAWHDIRVVFSSTTEPQKEDVNLRDLKWLTTSYVFCLGVATNKVNFISKGVVGSRNKAYHLVHVENEADKRCTSCGEVGAVGFGIWERYWFSVKSKSKPLPCASRKPALEDQVLSKNGTIERLKLQGEETTKDDEDDEDEDDDEVENDWVLNEDEVATVVEVKEDDDDVFRLKNPGGEESDWTSRANFAYASIRNPVAVLACGKGNFGQNVIMTIEDTEPVTGLKYTGLACWNESTVYCDLKVDFPFD